ncbi:MAG: uracil-DNA glycosylase [Proteobacteria bacterium]|nr:uracil-DNA glycosylase [Pseudomonadota bacterium]
MGSSSLTPRKELKEIVTQLRTLVVLDRDIGLEPPPVNATTLAYLDNGTPSLNSLLDLRNFIGDCKRCKLSHGRTNIVFGEGSSKARLIFVGEGPGREEDLAGRPFVGEAGKLLTRIIEKGMGLKREEVYICNIVKCRPPNNRDPEEDEIETCIPFLKQQLQIIRPEVICTLGRVAAQGLMGRAFKITAERGKWLSMLDIPLMPTYHPAYLLRNPSAKRQVWEDAQEIMRRMGLEVKEHV